jgi:hypothetical protein
LLARSVRIGEYDTASHGWTLTGYKLSDPEQKTNYIEKAGGDGSWDLSTVNTEGIPRYKDRSLTVTLEHSGSTRDDRMTIINYMVNKLDGLTWQIVLPDRPGYYLTGRVHVREDYNDPAHAAVTITATCSPWLYKVTETEHKLTAASTTKTVTLTNEGRLAMVPTLKITGTVALTYGSAYINLTTVGTYEWPDLLLTPGDHVLEYSGTGTLEIKYREAVLK